ncbi:MAG: hypothetical protein GQ476_02570, partial [Candidatus Aminicenantes bacterium]|nr:hypothetical protein [Candidatus Aminicenantes bacterium]
MKRLFSFNESTKRSAFPTWMVMFTLAMFLFAVASTTTVHAAQEEEGEIEQSLKQLTEKAANGYFEPVVTPIGIDLNGGWFHKVPPAKMFGLDLELGVVGMVTFLPEDVDRTFSVTDENFKFSLSQADLLTSFVFSDPLYAGLPADVQSAIQQEVINQITGQEFTIGISGATIVGLETDTIKINFSEATFDVDVAGYTGQVTVPTQQLDLGFGGLSFLADMSSVPLAAPQLSIGTVLGTRATIRYVPTIDLSTIPGASLFLDEDFGKISYFGFGLQHNPGVFLPTPLPLDFAVAFYTQTFKIGEEFFKAKTTSWGLNVSKQLGIG